MNPCTPGKVAQLDFFKKRKKNTYIYWTAAYRMQLKVANNFNKNISKVSSYETWN